MSKQSATRKLTTIFFTDVVGYSRLTGVDEEGTHQGVMAVLDIAKAAIVAEGGSVLRYAGDAILAEFSSAVSGVKASVVIQRQFAAQNEHVSDEKKLLLRIGINLGDVLADRGEVYGDGVNIAARLESICVPGGVCTSDKVWKEVAGKVDAAFQDGGKHTLKNIAEPLKVWHWHPDPGLELPKEEEGRKPKLMLMPFEPLGSDEQTTTLTASVTEELATALTKVKGIDVVTKPGAADYLAKGSVRVSGKRFRITVQLLEKSTQSPFWSDRVDDTTEDVFEALDRLAVTLSTAFRYQIYQRETDKLKQTPVEDQTSQELMGQAGHILFQSKRASYERSRELISVVLEREPDNAMALAIAAWGRAMMEVICGYGAVAADDGKAGLDQVRRSIELNEQSDFGHMVHGRLLLHCERDISGAILEAERSLQLNPGYVLAMGLMGAAKTYSGEAEAGIEYSTKALKANANFPANHWFMEDIALGQFVREDYAAAVDAVRRADQMHRDVPRILLMLTTASWHAGQADVARKTGERFEEAYPGFRVGAMRPWVFENTSHWDRFKRGLIEAGLRE